MEKYELEAELMKEVKLSTVNRRKHLQKKKGKKEGKTIHVLWNFMFIMSMVAVGWIPAGRSGVAYNEEALLWI